MVDTISAYRVADEPERCRAFQPTDGVDESRASRRGKREAPIPGTSDDSFRGLYEDRSIPHNSQGVWGKWLKRPTAGLIEDRRKFPI